MPRLWCGGGGGHPSPLETIEWDGIDQIMCNIKFAAALFTKGSNNILFIYQRHSGTNYKFMCNDRSNIQM